MAAVGLAACKTTKVMNENLVGNQLLTVDAVAVGSHSYLVVKPLPGTWVMTSSHEAPDVNDSGTLLSVAAAFTSDDLTTVCGDHVVAGKLIKGYDDVTATGHMLIVDGKVSIRPNDVLKSSMKSAIDRHGYLFQQCYIVENGVDRHDRIPQAILDRRAHIIYRCAALLADGNLAVIQGIDDQYPEEFVAGLVKLGVRDALYLDMGSWAYGWYRTRAGGMVHELARHYDNTRYQSNWLIIKAKIRNKVD